MLLTLILLIQKKRLIKVKEGWRDELISEPLVLSLLTWWPPSRCYLCTAGASAWRACLLYFVFVFKQKEFENCKQEWAICFCLLTNLIEPTSVSGGWITVIWGEILTSPSLMFVSQRRERKELLFHVCRINMLRVVLALSGCSQWRTRVKGTWRGITRTSHSTSTVKVVSTAALSLLCLVHNQSCVH